MHQLKTTLFLTALTILFAAGCGGDQSSGSADKLTKEAGEAVEAVKAYASEKKTQFQEQAEEKLTEYQERIDELKVKAEKATGEAKEKFNETMAEWNGKKEALKRQMEEFKTATAENWAKVENQINQGIEELGKLYEKARSAVL
ncbi:MAG: hypothetical protein OEN50_09330 [Deltaproteobacteria bacterium]|nr:hypothetical protein [Deltaproteobacteria bacterium]